MCKMQRISLFHTPPPHLPVLPQPPLQLCIAVDNTFIPMTWRCTTTDPPNELSDDTVTDLADVEYITFLKAFQASYNNFHNTPHARVCGSQKSWVLQHVLGPFQKKFWERLHQLLSWYMIQNLCLIKSIVILGTTPGLTTRLNNIFLSHSSWYVLGWEQKEAISVQAKELHEVWGWGSDLQSWLLMIFWPCSARVGRLIITGWSWTL